MQSVTEALRGRASVAPVKTPEKIPLHDSADHWWWPVLRLTTFYQEDVGLVGAPQHSREIDPSADLEQLDQEEAAALSNLGLPTSFGAAKAAPRKGRRKGGKRSAARDHAAAVRAGDAAQGEALEAGGPPSPSAAHPPPDVWVQAYDSATGHPYFYNEARQVTQWTPPEGEPYTAFGVPWAEGDPQVEAEAGGRAASAAATPAPGLHHADAEPPPPDLPRLRFGEFAGSVGSLLRTLDGRQLQQPPSRPETTGLLPPGALEQRQGVHTVWGSSEGSETPSSGAGTRVIGRSDSGGSPPGERGDRASRAPAASTADPAAATDGGGGGGEAPAAPPPPPQQGLLQEGPQREGSALDAAALAEVAAEAAAAAMVSAAGASGALGEQARAVLADDAAAAAVAQRLAAVAADVAGEAASQGIVGCALERVLSERTAAAAPAAMAAATAALGGLGADAGAGAPPVRVDGAQGAPERSGGEASPSPRSVGSSGASSVGGGSDARKAHHSHAGGRAPRSGKQQRGGGSGGGDAVTAAHVRQVLPRRLGKYWLQRYSLFSRFDLGAQMDATGWYSVTPEVVAAHQAERCACGVMVDAFAGCGGNAIQFALRCNLVIAVEIDPRRLDMARHNAELYGVAHRIEWVCADFLAVAPQLVADAVFLSPPWGGPAYRLSDAFDVSAPLGEVPASLAQLIDVSCGIVGRRRQQRRLAAAEAPRPRLPGGDAAEARAPAHGCGPSAEWEGRHWSGVACFLPRNVNLGELCDLAHVHLRRDGGAGAADACGRPQGGEEAPWWPLDGAPSEEQLRGRTYWECERNVLNHHFKGVTVYCPLL